MRKRGKQANLQRLGNVLQGILKEHNIFFDSEEQRLLEVWQKAVGPQISVQTRPDRLKRNTLFVKVSSSVWMHQLHILKQDIIEKINQLLGKELITNIHFSIGEIPSAMPTNSYSSSFSPDSYPLRDKDKKLIEKSISSVADPELKEILRRVMTKNIIRRRLSGNRKAL
ncbi:MAG: DUF721 domain-containing protein [Deltaproteobacteria bacterium]|jgi:hypothetical protein|nr:MAG: DUF721 domain-containing protein [Deltaproteobacteria bacterium]